MSLYHIMHIVYCTVALAIIRIRRCTPSSCILEIPVLSVCGPLGVGNDLSVSEVGLLATVVGVILTVLFGVVGVALITVVRVAVLSSVVEGALLIATVNLLETPRLCLLGKEA